MIAVDPEPILGILRVRQENTTSSSQSTMHTHIHTLGQFSPENRKTQRKPPGTREEHAHKLRQTAINAQDLTGNPEARTWQYYSTSLSFFLGV